MGPDFSGGDPTSPRDEQLVFMSDASAEAERLMSALRSRGYNVVEVPLALLVGRVSVQKPALILCDVDAAPALEQVRRLREIPGANQIDIVFFGQPNRTLDELRDEVFHESSGFFVRPVDAYGLIRKVEALIGPPSNPIPRMTAPSSRPPPSLPRAGPDSNRPPASRPPATSVSQPPPASAQTPQVASTTPPKAPPRISSIPDSDPSSYPPAESSNPPIRPASIPAPPEPSLPRPVPLGFGVEPEAQQSPLGRHIPQSEISAELESILARAEQRVGGAEGSIRAPASMRLSPDAEVDAVLPVDVLSALDEPLDIDEEEEDESGGTGTGGGSSSGGSGRTGLGTGGGRTGVGTGVGSLAIPPPPGSEPRSAAGPTAAPPRRDSVDAPVLEIRPATPSSEEPPKTPPAVPTRSPEPPSWPPPPMSALSSRTSVEPKPTSARDQELHTAVLRPTPMPPAPTPNGIRLPPLAEPTPEPAPRAKPGTLEIPSALGKGDSALALARAIRSRYSGALAFETDAGIRRIVLRDGDFVTAASGIASESLVAFLTERGTLSPDVQKALGHKLPPFGRHAGAALIAHGHLRQDELWPVLRAHAEWLVGRVLGMLSGAAGLEPEIPARLQAEPAVFGGATGAEVYVEIVRRVVPPDEALSRLGGPRARLVDGPNAALLGECALSPDESTLSARAKAATLGEVLGAGTKADLPAVLYALVQLGVLEALAPSANASPRPAEHARPYDALDEQALRARILARKALVDEGDYFALLGVAKTATSYDVQRAYSELRREFEPSRILTASSANLRGEVDLILEVLDEAYEILSDQLRRERYRRALEATPG